jgi:hypothetical protein
MTNTVVRLLRRNNNKTPTITTIIITCLAQLSDLCFTCSITKTAVRHLGALTLFHAPPADIQAKLKVETLDLNPPAEATRERSLARLDKLCKSKVGGVLLAVKHWDQTKAAFGEPVLAKIVANPAVASLGALEAASDPPGIDLGEVWDLTASSPFDQFPADNSACPLMVSAGGCSRKVKPTLGNCLTSMSHLFIPSGKKAAGFVQVLPTHVVN